MPPLLSLWSVSHQLLTVIFKTFKMWSKGSYALQYVNMFCLVDNCQCEYFFLSEIVVLLATKQLCRFMWVTDNLCHVPQVLIKVLVNNISLYKVSLIVKWILAISILYSVIVPVINCTIITKCFWEVTKGGGCTV